MNYVDYEDCMDKFCVNGHQLFINFKLARINGLFMAINVKNFYGGLAVEEGAEEGVGGEEGLGDHEAGGGLGVVPLAHGGEGVFVAGP